VLLCITAEFFAISFLMIYVGAIAILLVFGLMVVRSDIKLPRLSLSIPAVILLGLIAKLIILACQQINVRFSYEVLPTYLTVTPGDSLNVGLLSLLEISNDINIFGLYLYNTYVDLFLFSGVILAISILAVIKLLIPSNNPAAGEGSCPNV